MDFSSDWPFILYTFLGCSGETASCFLGEGFFERSVFSGCLPLLGVGRFFFLSLSRV